ncbi:hypothetical protein AN639_05785 [Candidatus Epulonipiscium fishelsonii]|nr:hypothetical protein AN639_05785 [Epulopiscium sp. SCG-B05WGA-EpuloA1]
MIYGMSEIDRIARIEIYNEFNSDSVDMFEYISADKARRTFMFEKVLNWESSKTASSIQPEIYKIVRIEMYNEFGTGIIDIDDYLRLSKPAQTRLFKKVVAWEKSLILKKVIGIESSRRGAL